MNYQGQVIGITQDELDAWERWYNKPLNDVIVEIIIQNGHINTPYKHGIAWTFIAEDRLLCPNCIPGIISLVNFKGQIDGKAFVLYAMDKYMIIDTNITLYDCGGYSPWFQANQHFMDRGIRHASCNCWGTALPQIPVQLYFNDYHTGMTYG